MTHKTPDARGQNEPHHGPEVLRECAEACSRTLAYCVSQGGEHVKEAHIIALVDCAELCNVTANFVARDSHAHMELGKVCAEACRQCASACENFDGDPTMVACAEVCRRCEQAIRAASTRHA